MVVAPDPDVAAVNVVVPHPLDMVTPDGDAIVNMGSTRAMLSLLVCTSAAFSSKVYATEDGEYVVGSAITSLLVDSAGATVAVDFVIFTAAMSATFASCSTTAAVRELESAACAVVLVVTPVAIDNEHTLYAGSMAPPADSVSVAVLAPELALATVNVVLPHPLTATAASVPNWNAGSSRAMVSGVALVSRGEFSANMNVMDDGAAVTGLAITSWLCWKAGVGAVTAVDWAMATAAMSAAAPRVTATVRVFRSAA